jgi:hypothetical protein
MSNHGDVGNVGLFGTAIGGTATATGTLAQWMTINATIIGIGLTVLSLVIGIAFKLWDSHRDRKYRERQHQEMLALQVEEERKTREALLAELRAR